MALGVTAFRQNMLFFYTPSQLAAVDNLDHQQSLRLGGLVGTISRVPGSLEINFEVTDTAKTVLVSYTGVLPDLFREGQGVVVRGKLTADGNLLAEEVLAKHDENYLPPEVAAGLAEVGVQWNQRN